VSGSRDSDEIRPPSSPVCHAEEAEANPLATDEMVALLNELLEGERAGAQGLVKLAERQASAPLAELLLDVFLDKLLAREGLSAQLDLLDRGQSAVARMILTALPRIPDRALVERLTEMYDVHVENIRRCAEAAAALPRG